MKLALAILLASGLCSCASTNSAGHSDGLGSAEVILYHEGRTVYPINDPRNPEYDAWVAAWVQANATDP